MKRFVVLVGIVVSAASACVPHVDERTTRMPRVSGEPVATRQTRVVGPVLNASLRDDVIEVTATRQEDCRWVATTPVEGVVRTERSLRNGTLAQGTNLAVGGLLLAVGIAAYAAADGADCSKTPDPTPSVPNPTSRACTDAERNDQAKGNHAFGIGLATTSIIPFGLFVWNVVRATDSERSEPMEARKTESPWKPCASVPLAGVQVELQVGGRTTRGTTDDRGLVPFDLARVEAPLLEPAQATIAFDDPKLAAASVVIDVGKTEYRERWRAAANRSSQTAWDRARQADRNEQDSMLDDAEAELDALEAKPEPWADAELARVRKVSFILEDLERRHSDGSPPRVEQAAARLHALDAKTKRLIAAMQKRKEEEAAEQAKRAKAAAEEFEKRRGSCFDPCYAQCVGSGQFLDNLKSRCRVRCFEACQ